MAERAARAHHKKKILFACTANICRSPIAEAMFNALAEERELPWRAQSAGVAALIDEDIAPHARIALEEVGIYAERHRARQVSEEMLEEADLVLTLGPRHSAALRRHFGDLPDKIYTLPEYATGASGEEGIPDPYGHTMTAYRASARQLLGYLDLLVSHLEKGKETSPWYPCSGEPYRRRCGPGRGLNPSRP